MPVTLESQSAQWAKFCITERAEELLKAAKAARVYGNRNVVARPAAEFVATVYERQARALSEALREINPQEQACP